MEQSRKAVATRRSQLPAAAAIEYESHSFNREFTMVRLHRIVGVATLAGSLMTLALAPAPAAAQERTAKVRTGTLTCEGKGKVGLLLGSREKLTCTYSPTGKGPKHELVGTVTNIGLDVGIKGPSVMVWGVLGSTTALPREALYGRFVGAAADASLGIGAGAKVLVGGNKQSVVLQPLSVQGQVGVNLAVGVTGLRLEPR